MAFIGSHLSMIIASLIKVLIYTTLNTTATQNTSSAPQQTMHFDATKKCLCILFVSGAHHNTIKTTCVAMTSTATVMMKTTIRKLALNPEGSSDTCGTLVPSVHTDNSRTRSPL